MQKVTINIQTILAYLISAFIIFGASMYNYLDNTIVSRTLWKGLQIICFGISAVLFGSFSKKTFKSAVMLLAYLALYSVVSILFSAPSVDNLVAYVLCFVFAYMYVSQLLRKKSFYKLIDAYSNLIFIVTVISLLFWLFGSVLGIIPYTVVPYHYGYGTKAHNFFWLYFDEPIQNTVFFGIRTVRNCGICMEAPGFANLLMYGLVFEMIRKNRKPVKSIVFILGLITNFSSKSYLLLAVAMIFGLYHSFRYNNRLKHRNELLIIIVPIIVLALGAAVYLIINDKATNSVRAYTGRVNSLQNAIEAWLSQPLIGAGINNYEQIGAGSMGVTLFLAQCGIAMMSIYIYAGVSAYRTKLVACYKWEFYLFISMFLVNFVISNVGTSTLTILVASTGIAMHNLGLSSLEIESKVSDAHYLQGINVSGAYRKHQRVQEQ